MRESIWFDSINFNSIQLESASTSPSPAPSIRFVDPSNAEPWNLHKTLLLHISPALALALSPAPSRPGPCLWLWLWLWHGLWHGLCLCHWLWLHLGLVNIQCMPVQCNCKLFSLQRFNAVRHNICQVRASPTKSGLPNLLSRLCWIIAKRATRALWNRPTSKGDKH